MCLLECSRVGKRTKVANLKVEEQAEKYGHSQTRELAFLVAHSMLHLCGYDHMEEQERIAMEKRQEEILSTGGFAR